MFELGDPLTYPLVFVGHVITDSLGSVLKGITHRWLHSTHNGNCQLQVCRRCLP